MMLESLTTTNNDISEMTLPNIHPGEILQEEFLLPMNLTAYRLAKETGLQQTRISEIVKGKRSITADTALRFAKFFGTSPEFWMNLQNAYDMEEAFKTHFAEIKKIEKHTFELC